MAHNTKFHKNSFSRPRIIAFVQTDGRSDFKRRFKRMPARLKTSFPCAEQIENNAVQDKLLIKHFDP
jgi:hypothetical protein